MLSQFASFFVSPFGEPSVTDELNKFLRGHRILNVEKRSIDDERGTGWLFLIEYTAGDTKEASPSAPKIDYKAILTEADYLIFNKLRDLRKILADKAGCPMYAVFTNEQLSAIAKSRPASSAGLLAISGVGDASLV